MLLSVFTHTILLLVSNAYTYFVIQSLVKVEKPQLVELVEGLGVYISAYNLLSVFRASKQSPSALLRQLMDMLFTKEEMATYSVRGKGN